MSEMEIQNIGNNFDKSVECRWSPKLKAAGWTAIADVFIENYYKLDINPNEAMFLVHCFKYKWTVKSPYVSLLKVSVEMGKHRDTVQRYARDLEAKGLIKREFRRGLPSFINLKPLIQVLETFVIYPRLTKEAMQNIRKPYVRIHTKEETLRRTFKENISDNGTYKIGDIINLKRGFH